MRRLIWPVLFLLLILLQGAASVFFTGWLSCDLPLLFLYSFALLRGHEKGGIAGAAIGFVQDALTVGVFGFHMLTRSIFGFAVGLMNKKVFKEQLQLHIMIIGLCSMIIRFSYWWIELIRADGRWEILPLYIWVSIGYCLGNMLLIAPMVKLVILVYEWIKEEDVSY